MSTILQQSDLGIPFVAADGGNVVTERWQHIAGVADGENLVSYLNGVEVARTPYDGTINRDSGEALGLGDSATALSGIRYNGLVDELAIWNIPLTSEEIRSHFLAGPAGYGLDGLGGGDADFLRGDADDSGSFNVTDGVVLLNFLFGGAAPPTCLDAADANDSGQLSVTTGVYIFNWLFLGGPAPLPPGTETCGPDPTDDTLDCMTYTSCL